MSDLELRRLSPGYYETDAGHRIERHGSGSGAGVFWAIAWPGERAPDVARPTLREAWDYVQQFPAG